MPVENNKSIPLDIISSQIQYYKLLQCLQTICHLKQKQIKIYAFTAQ